MHDLQTIVTDVHSVCQSVCHGGSTSSVSICEGLLVQPLPNHFGLLFRMA